VATSSCVSAKRSVSGDAPSKACSGAQTFERHAILASTEAKVPERGRPHAARIRAEQAEPLRKPVVPGAYSP
jgi:hypothetical protein